MCSEFDVRVEFQGSLRHWTRDLPLGYGISRAGICFSRLKWEGRNTMMRSER